jgi:hypothetical protein
MNKPEPGTMTETWSPEQLLGLARSNCRKCYGRGYDGIMQDDRKHICSCVLNKLRQTQKPGQVRIVADNEPKSKIKEIDPADIF